MRTLGIRHWTMVLFGALTPLAAASPAAASQVFGEPFEADRQQMISALEERGIENSRVLDVFKEIPRHRFVPEGERERAYREGAIPLGEGQALHEPYVVAKMTELLKLDKGARVLEIGTGSGYHSAILSKLAGQVFTIEIDAERAKAAKRLLDDLGCDNVHTRIGDGYQGWARHAPFDAIILTAAPPRIPQPLLDQLRVGGRMVVPVGEFIQDLMVITKTEEGYEKRITIPVNLPTMSGEAQGESDSEPWAEPPPR